MAHGVKVSQPPGRPTFSFSPGASKPLRNRPARDDALLGAWASRPSPSPAAPSSRRPRASRPPVLPPRSPQIDEKTRFQGQILKVSGPLVVGDLMSGSFMHELVRVGAKRIVGEIIKLEGDTASIQCYEDTSGLTVGDIVHRTQVGD